MKDIKIFKNASFPGILEFTLKGSEDNQIKLFIWDGVNPTEK